jgi:hypothetical protein
MAYSSTYCLDVSGSGISSGTAVITYRCGSGNNQKWTIDSNNRFVPGHTTGRCLDTENGTIIAGARLVIRTCSTVPSQQVAVISCESPVPGIKGSSLGLHEDTTQLGGVDRPVHFEVHQSTGRQTPYAALSAEVKPRIMPFATMLLYALDRHNALLEIVTGNGCLTSCTWLLCPELTSQLTSTHFSCFAGMQR